MILTLPCETSLECSLSSFGAPCPVSQPGLDEQCGIFSKAAAVAEDCSAVRARLAAAVAEHFLLTPVLMLRGQVGSRG